MAMTGDLASAPVTATLAEGDMEQGRRFWRDTLGFQEIDYDETQKEATYRAGQGTWFGIYQHEGGSRCDHTQMSFAIQDIDSAVQALRQKGVRFEEYDLPYLKTQSGIADMGGGSKGAWFKDPGGNIVGLFQPSAESWQRMQSAMQMAGVSRG